MTFFKVLIELLGFMFLLIIGLAVIVSGVECVFGITIIDTKVENNELKKQELKQECRENISEVESKYSITQKNKVIELLLDGYEIYWQAPFTIMLVEDLSLVVHHLEKENNLVEIVEIKGFITILKKRCA